MRGFKAGNGGEAQGCTLFDFYVAWRGIVMVTQPPPLHGNPTACRGNPYDTPMSTAPRVKVKARVRVRVPWYAVEFRGRSVVCRGRFCRRWCHANATACRDKGQ